jgi:lysyl-tRNA synthetase class 2
MPEDSYSEEELNRLIRIRYEKLQKLISKHKNPYAYSFNRNADASLVKSRFSNIGHEPSAEKVRLAGRVMRVRDHGKSCFVDLKDRSGRIQLYASVDRTEEYNSFLELDEGDIIGVEGNVFRTKKGEITVSVLHFELLAKSLRPLPEKYHGLKDVESRYRMRYVDLIVNEDAFNNFIKRSRFISFLRRWLDQRDFIEVETPILTPIPSGALARPFITHYNFLQQDFYLRIATELYLKRLIVGGMEKVYEIGKDFRNEDMDTTHNPEFTMMELYQAYADYRDMMDLAEQMISEAVLETNGSLEVQYQSKHIDFRTPWRRISMLDAIREIGEIDLPEYEDREALYSLCTSLGLHDISDRMSSGELIAEIFDQRVQPVLMQPTIVFDYPAEVSPLAKKKRGDTRFAERFECFVNGFEVANAFSELNNPIEQKENFELQMEKKRAGDEEAHPYDEDYITALEFGMPPTGGLGVGIDRLVMLITGAQSIKDVILFPQLRRK